EPVKIAIRPSETEEATPLELDAFRCAVRADGQRGFRMGPGEGDVGGNLELAGQCERDAVLIDTYYSELRRFPPPPAGREPPGHVRLARSRACPARAGIVDRKDLETCVSTELRLLARDAYTGVLAVSLVTFSR